MHTIWSFEDILCFLQEALRGDDFGLAIEWLDRALDSGYSPKSEALVILARTHFVVNVLQLYNYNCTDSIL